MNINTAQIENFRKDFSEAVKQLESKYEIKIELGGD